MTPWTCAECDAKNPASAEGRFCRSCGSARNAAISSAPTTRAPEWLPPWRQPGWVEPKDTDRCTEPGCTKTAREHIEEFRAIVSRPDTVLSRPSQRVSAEERALALAALRMLPTTPIPAAAWTP